ncbi:hypothetical protein EX30DRAFT_337708 [Ascodesmis nigricans]|uniref:Uncharacterized protein n=1 Tax=Ascodesmis nigricans TaxID=341454 RepID=A0A4S2N7K5_9PEZI|nr:hypothetical protein EX30DRAFT_337708 [Ascodesmis nigricans]
MAAPASQSAPAPAANLSLKSLEELKETLHYDTQHPLQHVDIYQTSKAPETVWIVFIHGGAWRDPTKTTSVCLPLFTHLHRTLNGYQSPTSSKCTPTTPINPAIPPFRPLPPSSDPISFASLSYRLSPHPEYPNVSPPNTSQHPDHINDVEAGIAFLKRERGMRRYIVVGHSAGGTMGGQMIYRSMQRWRKAIAAGEKVEEPHKSLISMIGVEGIYSLPSISTEGGPEYDKFLVAAFGPKPAASNTESAEKTERNTWEEASPAITGIDGYKGLVVLVHSDEDKLVSWDQVDEMKTVVENTRGVGGGCRVLKVKGEHDEVLEEERFGCVVEGLVRELVIKPEGRS